MPRAHTQKVWRWPIEDFFSWGRLGKAYGKCIYLPDKTFKGWNVGIGVEFISRGLEVGMSADAIERVLYDNIEKELQKLRLLEADATTEEGCAQNNIKRADLLAAKKMVPKWVRVLGPVKKKKR